MTSESVSNSKLVEVFGTKVKHDSVMGWLLGNLCDQKDIKAHIWIAAYHVVYYN